jgi:hypothetical protein
MSTGFSFSPISSQKKKFLSGCRLCDSVFDYLMNTLKKKEKTMMTTTSLQQKRGAARRRSPRY